MTRSFNIKADRVAIPVAFARKEFEGVSIHAVPSKKPRPNTKPGESVLTFDSAEDFLHFVVSLSRDVGVPKDARCPAHRMSVSEG